MCQRLISHAAQLSNDLLESTKTDPNDVVCEFVGIKADATKQEGIDKEKLLVMVRAAIAWLLRASSGAEGNVSDGTTPSR